MMDAVIFDCDGVLIDSEIINLRLELACLAEIGLHYDAHEYSERFLGGGEFHFFNSLDQDHRERLGRPLPSDFSERLSERALTEMEASLTAIQGVHNLVEKLRAPKAIASGSGIRMLEKKLRKTQLFDAFAPHIYSSQLVAKGKPEPDIYLYAAEKLGVRPSSCVAIEDSVNGVKSAVSAGMDVIGFVGGGHCLPQQGGKLLAAGAAQVVTHMEDLFSALDGGS